MQVTETHAAVLKQRNLRDLGGLPTRDPSLVVHPGRFFRSSSPSGFNSDERRAFAALSPRLTVDLRTDFEVAHSAEFPLENMRLAQIPLFRVARRHWIAPPDQSPGATAARYFEMLQDGLESLAAIVLELTQPDAFPVVISCSAGRDRTGIVVACLLDLLDVTEDAIAIDYAQSDSFDPTSGRAHAETMVQFLALIRSRFESTGNLLRTLGVTSGHIQSLRDQHLIRRNEIQ